MNQYDPALLECRRIFLRNYQVAANIGVYDAERHGPQRLSLNVDLYVAPEASRSTRDAIADVLDYDIIRQLIEQRVQRGHINLQETLCDDVSAALLALPGVRAVRVSSQKLDVYPDCDGVGVEVFHQQKATRA